MPDSIAGGGMRFDFSFKSRSDEEKSEEPLAIAILGDFGSHTSGAENKLSDPIRVDCDNFDEVFAKIGVTLDLPPSAKRAWEINLRFRTLEDFHPEQFLNQLKPLANLAELRAKLLHPESMDAAAKELQEALKIGGLPSETPPATSTESTEEMLGRLLGKPASEPDRVSSPVLLANRLIRQIIGANVPDVHPQQSQLVALADTELSERLRAILHHAAFQALESTWRGLDFLVRNIAEDVKLYVINLRQSELATMLSGEDLAKSVIYKQLEKIRPALVLGVYTFGPQDHTVLAGIARLANACHTAFVAGASPHLVGCSSFGAQPDPDDWTTRSSDELEGYGALRRMPEAVHLGLAMPRFLLRQPYGKGSDTIDAFPFEEIPVKPEHESYLWGNPAFLCGHLLADQFESSDSDQELRGGGEVSGLPIHKFTSDGETQVKPCAEAWLSERAAEAILSHGIMPVLSVHGRDAVQLLTLRALSDPPRPLAVGLEFRGE
jgi:type VI secretion system protein ImpC